MIFQWWQILLPYFGLLLLPWITVIRFGRCCANWQWDVIIFISLMADVIAIVCLMADVNAIGGWWNATEFYVVDVESVKNICKKYGIQVFFKGGKTIKDLLMAPKDRDLITQKSGIIYRYKCDRVECDDEYIGESARTFGERFKEHLKHPPIYDHNTITGHEITIDNFSIVGREDHNLMRLIKEAIYIRVNNPSLNKSLANTICLMCGMRFWITSQNSN